MLQAVGLPCGLRRSFKIKWRNKIARMTFQSSTMQDEWDHEELNKSDVDVMVYLGAYLKYYQLVSGVSILTIKKWVMGTQEPHLIWAELKIMPRNICHCCYSVTQVCIYSYICSCFSFWVKDAGGDLMNSSYVTFILICGHLRPKYNFLTVLRCSHGSLEPSLQRV